MPSRSRQTRITTADIEFGVRNVAEHHRWLLTRGNVQRNMRRVGIRPEQVGTPDAPNEQAPRAAAYPNYGRWVADCPSAYCGGAETLMPGGVFLCGECLNAEVGYKYRLVQWPAEQAAIEEELSKRPDPRSRNWYPGETVAALRAENNVRGIR